MSMTDKIEKISVVEEIDKVYTLYLLDKSNTVIIGFEVENFWAKH